MKRLLPSLVAAALIGCLRSGDRVSGTSHETETGNSISALVMSQGESPDSGLRVYVFSQGHVLPGLPDGEWADSGLTGARGAVNLSLPKGHTGEAYFQVRRDSALGLRIPLSLPARGEAHDLGRRWLVPTGVLRGEIILPPGDSGTVLLQLMGTPEHQILPAGAGAFVFRHLAAGHYTLRATGSNPARGPVEARVEVPSGDTAVLPPLSLEKTTGSVLGRVLLPPGTRGTIDVEAVGTRFRARADSLGRYFLGGLPPGLHTLRAHGAIPARDTVEAQATLRAGEATRVADLQLTALSLLIVDGLNNHDWKRLSPAYRATLEATGRFRVAVSTTPPFSSDSARWAAWRPDFAAHDAVLLAFSDVKDVYGASWPASVREALRGFVENGGGLVVTQASQSSFQGWDEFRSMIGLGWGRDKEYPGFYLDSALAPQSVPIGQDSSLTARGAFVMRSADSAHPVTRGLPPAWLHAEDAIDVGLRGPAKDLKVLQYFSPAPGARLQPAAWTVAYGKGRVFNTSLGDVVEGGPDTAVRCAGFQALLARGAEWASSGQVTLKLPSDFPSESAVSIRPAP